MPTLDVFNDDAFTVISLTDAINNLKFVPGRIGQMGLFSESGITTTSAVVEERDGVLVLVEPTPRGGPGQTIGRGARRARSFLVPHFEINDAVMADEVQNVRAFGSQSDVETVASKVAERQQIHTQSLAYTEEFSRVGAVKGIVTYADGTTLNLFNEFGVSQLSPVPLNLPSADNGLLRNSLDDVAKGVIDQLGGVSFNGLYAFTGHNFWNKFTANPEVRATYLGWIQAAELRNATVGVGVNGGFSYGAMIYGGIAWDYYRGQNGGTPFIGDDEAWIFPLGVPGLFRTIYAPADYEETVNTVGQPRYTKQYAMPNGKGRNLDSQMNALEICTRPGVLQQVTVGS